MASDLPFTSATELASAIRAKEVSPVEALETYLARVDLIDPVLNAFAFRDDDRALADARAAADRLASGPADELPPLFGVPMPIKDLDDVAGWPTTLGSFASHDGPRPTDGFPAARLRAAGAVLMGKTTTPEFGTVSFTESDRLGITRNPWNPDHTPGGSSGGAAAAVASGMAPIAHGSDGAGSIRIPSSCCNLVGLKPGRHRVTEAYESMAGAVTSGVLARTVADAALGLDVLAVRDPYGWNMAPPLERPFSEEIARDPGRLRIRLSIPSPLGIPIAPTVEAAMRRLAERLAALGHDVTEGEPRWPDVAEVYEAFLVMWSTGAATFDLADPDQVEAHDRPPANEATAFDYVRALKCLQLATRFTAEQFDTDFDLLLTPTMAVEPPRVGSWLENVPEEDPLVAILNCLPMGTFTAMFNLTGFPAISVPAEIGESGLPIGAQLVAGPWREALLFRVAAQLEAELRWHDRVPDLVTS
jgi:amidase